MKLWLLVELFMTTILITSDQVLPKEKLDITFSNFVFEKKSKSNQNEIRL